MHLSRERTLVPAADLTSLQGAVPVATPVLTAETVEMLDALPPELPSLTSNAGLLGFRLRPTYAHRDHSRSSARAGLSIIESLTADHEAAHCAAAGETRFSSRLMPMQRCRCSFRDVQLAPLIQQLAISWSDTD